MLQYQKWQSRIKLLLEKAKPMAMAAAKACMSECTCHIQVSSAYFDPKAQGDPMHCVSLCCWYELVAIDGHTDR